MDTNTEYRKTLKDRKRIVVKIGSSSLIHPETGRLDYKKIDKLACELVDLKNAGRDIILVSSGATAVGRQIIRVNESIMQEDGPITVKQACAAVGQARLMMIYQKFFQEYNQIIAQVLMTKNTVTDALSKYHLINTFTELLKFNIIPIVNENDSVETFEYKVGDNDSLSAIVASIMGADLLILLSDVDGLYTDNPRENEKASLVEFVEEIDDTLMGMAKSETGSSVGTGGMNTKLLAGKIATKAGCDMVIANSADVGIVGRIVAGENEGTLFRAGSDESFDLIEYLNSLN
ncbi:MAG: glutamate 5-kinase [Lachnospiraceae bacterium]|nr:glutamate 5-kinase [Lachnospiraceae bacterium]